MNDEFFIKRTIALALKARGRTSPNPMVGAVLVKNNRIIAEACHKSPGTPHAEALAIEKVGTKAKGATLYINLEPCCHMDKRTPPCTRAIIASGLKKVVIAMQDPNPKVAGKGILELEDAGIKVVSGVMEEKAKKLNEAYIKFITTKKPFVTLKLAMTLDGKIATPEGQSKWITGEKARLAVHRLRDSVDAIMTGIGTVIADDPELTVRLKRTGDRRQQAGKPIRIVIDPELQISTDARILKTPPETIIVTREQKNTDTHLAKINYLIKSGCNMILFKDKLELLWLMERLGEMGIASLLIEAGSSLNAHALEDKIVDKVMVFIAPKIIGGKESYPAVGGKTFRRLEDAFKLRDTTMSRIGEDFLITGYL